MLKAKDNPPILPPGIDSLAQLNGHWRVAHTKARCEKVFAWDLLHHKIGYFLPLIERTYISGGRKRRVPTPLFPSYVFFCGSEDDRHKALTTNRLCQILEVVDQKRFVVELLAIEKAIHNNASLDLYPQPALGQRCRITAGAMKDLEGVVVQRTKPARLVLEVKLLGQGAVMEVDTDLLEPL
jgi:transcription antitermination factor NusG